MKPEVCALIEANQTINLFLNEFLQHMKKQILATTTLMAFAMGAEAVTIASQDFGLTNFASPTSFAGAGPVTHTSTNGSTDLGFTASGQVAGAGFFGVNADEHFRFSHFAAGSNRSDLSFDNGDTDTGFVAFDSVNLAGFSSNSVSFTLDNNVGSSNSGDDDLVVRLFLNGSSTGTIIFDTRGPGDGAINPAQDVIDPSASYDSVNRVLTYDFLDSDTSAILRVDALVDDNGNDGYFIDNVVFSGTAVVVPEPSSTALIGIGGIALLLRRRK